MVGLTRAAVFLARLGQWERVPGGELLADQDPWVVERLFFPHCKMEPPWTEFAFAVDVSRVYERKRQALAAYQSIFRMNEDRLLAMYEAEDQYFGRMLGVAYAEIFRSAAPLLVEDPTVFLPKLLRVGKKRRREEERGSAGRSRSPGAPFCERLSVQTICWGF